MKATELMVGDWVNYWILNINAKVNDIMSTGRLGIRFIDTKGKEGYIHGVICETVKPIPLTAEILEKNGLELDRGWDNDNEYFFPTHFKEDVDARLEISMDNGKIYWSISCDEYHIIEIKYVHELQHALRLCGIKKEIVL